MRSLRISYSQSAQTRTLAEIRIEDFKHKAFEYFLPDGLTGDVWAAVFIAFLAGTFVLSLDVVARRMQS